MGPDRTKEVPVAVAAKLLHCSPSHVRNLFNDGKLKGMRYGPRKIYINREAIAEWIKNHNFGQMME